jgi:hypothetical protein
VSSTTTADRDPGPLERPEGDEPGVVEPAAARLGGTGLAGHRETLDAPHPASRAFLDDLAHDLPHAPGRLRPQHLPEPFGLPDRHALPGPVADLEHSLGLHQHAAVRDRGRDHRHLERGGQEPALADGGPGRIDARGGRQELPVLEQAGRADLEARVVEGQLGAEAEAVHVLAQALGSELASERPEGGVVGVDERLREVVLPG